jgi:RHS repeat-associated protein
MEPVTIFKIYTLILVTLLINTAIIITTVPAETYNEAMTNPQETGDIHNTQSLTTKEDDTPSTSSQTAENNNSNRFSFSGKELDEIDQYYFNARYYDPEIGRFTSPDPAGGLNLYTYCGNNPLRYVDLSGCNYADACPADALWVEGGISIPAGATIITTAGSLIFGGAVVFPPALETSKILASENRWEAFLDAATPMFIGLLFEPDPITAAANNLAKSEEIPLTELPPISTHVPWDERAFHDVYIELSAADIVSLKCGETPPDLGGPEMGKNRRLIKVTTSVKQVIKKGRDIIVKVRIPHSEIQRIGKHSGLVRIKSITFDRILGNSEIINKILPPPTSNPTLVDHSQLTFGQRALLTRIAGKPLSSGWVLKGRALGLIDTPFDLNPPGHP